MTGKTQILRSWARLHYGHDIENRKDKVIGHRYIGRITGTVDGPWNHRFEIENVDNFTYFRSNDLTYNFKCLNEVKWWAVTALGSPAAMDKIWKSKTISLEPNKKMLETCIFGRFPQRVWNMGHYKSNWKKGACLWVEMLWENSNNCWQS